MAFGRTDLGLTNSAPRLDIDDDASRKDGNVGDIAPATLFN
jgi:hypothetical protein